MKATGIVRRIDDLGRIVVPKEIRRTLRIREGDPLEIFTDREGEIILKKYSPIGELGNFAQQYADALTQVNGNIVLVSDKDQFIAAAAGGGTSFAKSNWPGKRASHQLERAIDERANIAAMKEDRDFIKLSDEAEDNGIIWQIIAPIICEGDAIGSVIILGKDTGKTLTGASQTRDTGARFGELEIKLASTAATFLGKQMEG